MEWVTFIVLGVFATGLLWLLFRYWLVYVKVNQFLVMTFPYTDKVRRVLPPGVHLIGWPLEVPFTTLDSLPRRLNLLLDRVNSLDGVPFKVRAVLLYRLDLRQVIQDDLASLLPFLSNDPAPVASLHTEERLRHQLSRVNTLQLIHGLDTSSLSENCIEMLRERLAPSGLAPIRLIVQEVLPPAAIQHALVTAQSQPFNTQAQLDLLQAIRDAAAGWQPDERDFTIAYQEAVAFSSGQIGMSHPLMWERLVRQMKNQ